MPVDTTHKHYEQFKTQTQKVRDCLDGDEAVKRRGYIYLPALSSHLEDGVAGSARYDAYRMRAMFYGAADRTAKGLTGAVMRKDPDVDFPSSLEAMLARLGQRAESLPEMIASSIEETVSVGRYAMLVDAPPDDAAASPFVVAKIEEEVYRVLRLSVPEGADKGAERIYTQELWARVKGPQGGDWAREETFTPEMAGGRTLTEIPIAVINPSKTGMKPEKPPMLDLVNVNLSHYRNSADLEHGRHWTALPTAWASGFPLFDPETQTPIELRVGSEAAWVTEKENARAGYLEFTGAGLGHIQTGMIEKQDLMAVLGARLLEESKKAAETAEAIRLRQGGERSVLTRVADTVSEGWTMVLRWVAQWVKPGEVGEVGVALSRDYDVARLSPEELTALVGAMQAGGISWNTVFWNLQRGEMVPDGVTEDEEARMILDGPPGAELMQPEPEPESEPEDDEDIDDEEEDEEAA